jgi:hypothetical protein
VSRPESREYRRVAGYQVSESRECSGDEGAEEEEQK